MKKCVVLFIALGLLLATTSLIKAATLNVGQGEPYSTIQVAIDNTSSQTHPSKKLSHVVFTSNYIHDVAGSIVFCGKIGEEIETAVISNNLIDYSMITSAASQCLVAIEINKFLDLTITDNVANVIPGGSIDNNDISGSGNAVSDNIDYDYLVDCQSAD